LISLGLDELLNFLDYSLKPHSGFGDYAIDEIVLQFRFTISEE
jgi:hypothetical protein